MHQTKKTTAKEEEIKVWNTKEWRSKRKRYNVISCRSNPIHRFVICIVSTWSPISSMQEKKKKKKRERKKKEMGSCHLANYAIVVKKALFQDFIWTIHEIWREREKRRRRSSNTLLQTPESLFCSYTIEPLFNPSINLNKAEKERKRLFLDACSSLSSVVRSSSFFVFVRQITDKTVIARQPFACHSHNCPSPSTRSESTSLRAGSSHIWFNF